MNRIPISIFRIVLILWIGCLAVVEAAAETAIFQIRDNGPRLSIPDRIGDKEAGHRNVIENIQRKATFSQSGFVLEAERLLASGKIESYQRFWITNAVSVTGDSATLAELGTREDVESSFDDMLVSLIAPVATGDALATSTGPERGLAVIRAPEVWGLGLDGAGRLVCNFDTGVNGNHAGLYSKYRGNNGGSAAESWFDPYSHTSYPVDGHGHGTHTMGTMVGSSGGDTVGVAPGAQWIAAAVVDRGGGIQRSITDLLAAFQWAADPDGDPSTTDDVPDVINNSWGIPLGYYAACDQTFWEAVDNLEAAGVVCLFAAGNEGPSPQTLRTPADRIASEFNCFSVGAVNGGDSNLGVASFSSRGPSGCDGVTIKPEVTAPGVSVRSAARTGGYVTMSGTSMATPHAAGAVAILRQFNPNATPSQIKQALMYSARDLGLSGEDNSYGWGVIDIRRALYYMPPPTNIFPVIVSHTISGDGIADPGEEISLSLAIENIGRPAVNLSAGLISLDANAQVLTGDLFIGNVDHNDTVTAGGWNIIFNRNTIAGDRIRFRLLLSGDSQSAERDIVLIVGGGIEPAAADHDNGLVAMGVSNIGQFGLGEESVNPMGGAGFRYLSGGMDFLKNGSLMIATDVSHVSDGAITANPLVTDNDFRPAEGGYPRISQPGLWSDQDGFAAYTDSAAENPIGVKIEQRSFCWTGDDAYPFVITEFTITNITSSPIVSLYAGIFCDWDLPLSSGNDDIVGYIDYESLGYVSDLSTGVSVGVKVIAPLASSYRAINYFPDLSDGFTESEKYQAMTSGFENISYSSPGNYAHLISTGPYYIGAGQSETAVFSFAAGNNLDELISNAYMSMVMYPNYTGVSAQGELPKEHSILSNYPNPFNGSTVITASGTGGDNPAVEIYDITGRLVRTVRLDRERKAIWDGKDERGREAAAGIYFARLESGGASSVRKMLYLK